MPNTAPGIADIALEAGNQMDMKVKYRLTGGGTAVDADVIAIGSIMLLDDPFGLMDGRDEGHLLGGRGLEPCRNVPSRDQEGVPGRYGVGVPQPKHLFAAKKNAVFGWAAEGTFHDG